MEKAECEGAVRRECTFDQEDAVRICGLKKEVRDRSYLSINHAVNLSNPCFQGIAFYLSMTTEENSEIGFHFFHS